MNCKAIAASVLAASALTVSLHAQRMIAIDSGRNISTVDLTTGTKTAIGQTTTNAGTTAGFAYDGVTGKLYLTSSSLDSVFLVDMSDWSAKLIGSYGLASVVMHGIEWDTSTNTLYGAGIAGEIYTVDTTTGQATLVGNTGLSSFTNLGYDLVNDTMWMTVSGSTDSLFSVDRTSAAATLIGPLVNSTNPNSLAWSIDDLNLYLADNSTDNLYTIDRTTGAANLIGPMGSGNVLGMAYIPGTGRLTRTPHGCGTVDVFVTGNPNIGGQVEFTVENATGFPFVGFGTASLNLPFCNCTVGHEWSASVGGSTATLPIPASASLIGADVYAQGMDFLGAGGCPSPQFALTDTVTISIGS